MTVETTQRCWAPSVHWDDPAVESYLASALGSDRLAAINAATVIPPSTTCIRVNTLRTTAESVLERLLEALTLEDRELIYASGRQPYISPQLPMAVMVPSTGPHTIDYSNCNGLEVIVGRKAGESMLRGAHAYAPGILACTSGIEKGDLVAVSVGIELPGTDLYGVTRGSVVDRHLPLDDPRFPNRAALFIGTALAEVSRSAMNPSSQGRVLLMKDRVYTGPGLNEVLPGEIMLQNLPSLVTAMVVGPKPGSRVLDMCAAPGGKTTAMAALMKNQGEIIALDRSHNKVVGVSKLAEELGITIIKAFKADAIKVASDRVSRMKGVVGKEYLEVSQAGQKRVQARKAAMRASMGLSGELPKKATTAIDGFEPESFDYVLLDGPCSALGLRPRLLLSQTLEELEKTAYYQRCLIDTAIRMVKPGGSMVYSTCTINPGENEANVRYLLDKHPCMKLVPQAPRLAGPGLSGVIANGRGGEQLLLTEEEASMVQRFDPSADLDTIGFFIAKFEKTRSSEAYKGENIKEEES